MQKDRCKVQRSDADSNWIRTRKRYKSLVNHGGAVVMSQRRVFSAVPFAFLTVYARALRVLDALLQEPFQNGSFRLLEIQRTVLLGGQF